MRPAFDAPRRGLRLSPVSLVYHAARLAPAPSRAGVAHNPLYLPRIAAPKLAHLMLERVNADILAETRSAQAS
jgi:hypothetical protein